MRKSNSEVTDKLNFRCLESIRGSPCIPTSAHEICASRLARSPSPPISSSNPAIQIDAWTGGFASQHCCWFAFVRMYCFDHVTTLCGDMAFVSVVLSTNLRYFFLRK